MKNLDEKDYWLLDLLAEGSRRGVGPLAKELRLHKNSVLYRIKRLRRMGVIQRFSFIPGIAAMGKNTFYVFFRLRLTEKEKTEVFSYLQNHPLALWVLRLSGSWSVLVELVCNDINHFNDELAKISERLGAHLLDYRTIFLYKSIKVESSIHFRKECREEMFKLGTIYSLDALDKKLLGLLADHSDLSYTELATKAQTTPDTILYRMKKLRQAGVIRRFVPILDTARLHLQSFAVYLKLMDIGSDTFHKLESHLIHQNNVYFAFRTAGELGILFFCSYTDYDALDRFLMVLSDSFGHVIREQEVFLVSAVLQLNYFPPGLR